MWSTEFDGTNRHSGRRFNVTTGGGRYQFKGPDPYCAFRFKIEVNGVTIGHFQDVSGLTWETEVVEQPEGGLNDRLHKLMGQTKFTNLVLKNGLTNSKELWNWRMGVLNSRSNVRRDGYVVLTDEGGNELARWNFTQGWPSKWEGPALSAGSSAITVETVEIAYNTLERV
jgi:phage tail-like protein